ncbi:hypothetical protein HBO10_04630 [Pseudomonas sp. WS 5503]|uniref:hypothetical protein n=1 Tax=Pseudomonas sp. WS 5503 TaxID=2717497 RepID=UPI0014740AD5|nr:hypothetical protein [Pseudomonas sp. WS 5503]NMX78812.1 hypothetical protein [Pseudomonas sp. WS 5503]
MKNAATISLYEPGIVLFDPIQLSGYLKLFKPNLKDVFDFFINNEEAGKKAVTMGIVFPIYEVPEREYSIFIAHPANPITQGATQVCHYSNLPIEITSGILIAADLNALIDWDEFFFTNYLENYKKNSTTMTTYKSSLVATEWISQVTLTCRSHCQTTDTN